MNSPLAVGSIVADTYRITSQLGFGGMGAVFAAEHLRLPGKHVAIKVLHNTMATAEILLRFRREAEIASRIGHPNIVEVLDFNTLPSGEPFLVMELLTGESLAARLRRGRLPEKTALDIARQIGSALDAAHRMDVVHRDLKPDNVFLCPRDVDGELRDHVKVLDFGISKIRNAATVLTQDAAILGTPFYMSPEQASGKNQEIDGRTDIFALGAIVFEMLTGVTAFPGESVPAVIFQVVFQPHPSLANLAPMVNPKVAAAVDRALAKSPAERFQTMAELVEALTGRPLMNTARLTTGAAGTAPTMAASGTALAGTAVAPAANAALSATSVAPPPPVRTVAPAPAKRGKGPWLFVAGAVVVVAAAAVAVVSRGRAPEPAPVATPPVKIGKTSPVVEEPPAVAVDASPVAAVPTPETQPAAGKREDKTPEKAPRGKGSGRDEALSPTLLADLEAGERALAAKDAAEAIRLARHSLYEKKTARASSIMTRAFCLQHDLGAAKAELAHLAASERARVLRACRAAGMDL
jgi:tRNA A-37 threonylcarbamoyl transferase component Bud32